MIDDVHRLAAFAHPGHGGNPAGVVLLSQPAAPADMLKTAAQVGFSETAFLWPNAGGWSVRYFSPRIEVPFCGHATIAAAACLGRQTGAGAIRLDTPAGQVQVTSWQEAGHWHASFDSPPTRSAPLDEATLQRLLGLFALTAGDLDPHLAPAVVHAGADHAQLALRSRESLRAMHYPFDALADLQREMGWATVALLHRDAEGVFHSRNAFAVGGVVEDPATGAAAAALGGYLRDSGAARVDDFVIRQGDDMEQPCLLRVRAGAVAHQGVTVSGMVRPL